MIRVDKMAQQAKEIRKALQPVFFLAMVEAVKAGWVVVFHLWYGNSSSYKRVTSCCPDLESVDKRVEDMRKRYPGEKEPVIIIDNLQEGG